MNIVILFVVLAVPLTFILLGYGGYKLLSRSLNKGNYSSKILSIVLIVIGFIFLYLSYHIVTHQNVAVSQDSNPIGALIFGLFFISIGLRLGFKRGGLLDFIRATKKRCYYSMYCFGLITAIFVIDFLNRLFYGTQTLNNIEFYLVELLIILICGGISYGLWRLSKLPEEFFNIPISVVLLDEFKLIGVEEISEISMPLACEKAWEKIQQASLFDNDDYRYFWEIPCDDEKLIENNSNYSYIACCNKKQNQEYDLIETLFPGSYYAVFEYEGPHAYLNKYMNDLMNRWLLLTTFKLKNDSIFVEYLNFKEWQQDNVMPKMKLYIPLTMP